MSRTTMLALAQEWLHLVLRWTHLVAGIAWIGNSFFFMWLDKTIRPGSQRDDSLGLLWMVHSGGFYQVEKYVPRPGNVPAGLHWFRWEAGITWISGFFLLSVVYYLGGGALLVDPAVSSITPGQAALLGLALLPVSWATYDGLWSSPLAQRPRLASAISFALAVLLAFGLTQVLSARGAFIHVGAVLGTLMAGNVWMRIIPSQRAMVRAVEKGEQPDLSQGKRAKTRSLHNNAMTFPLLFLMLSSHFPWVSGNRWNWLALVFVAVASAGVRLFMNARPAVDIGAGLVACAGAAAFLAITAEPVWRAGGGGWGSGPGGSHVPFAQAHAIVAARCLSCHSEHPRDDQFRVAPNGVKFDRGDQIRAYASRIRERVFVQKTMPLANKTAMSDEERALIARWVDSGALPE